jgi:hypothetical protein
MSDKLKEFVRQSIDELLSSLPPEDSARLCRLKNASRDYLPKNASRGYRRMK